MGSSAMHGEPGAVCITAVLLRLMGTLGFANHHDRTGASGLLRD